jgi:hypothetical protein
MVGPLAASAARNRILDKLAQLTGLFTSEEILTVIERLDASTEVQATAQADLKNFMEENKIILPEGVSLTATSDRININIEILFSELKF